MSHLALALAVDVTACPLTRYAAGIVTEMGWADRAVGVPETIISIVFEPTDTADLTVAESPAGRLSQDETSVFLGISLQ